MNVVPIRRDMKIVTGTEDAVSGILLFVSVPISRLNSSHGPFFTPCPRGPIGGSESGRSRASIEDF